MTSSLLVAWLSERGKNAYVDSELACSSSASVAFVILSKHGIMPSANIVDSLLYSSLDSFYLLFSFQYNIRVGVSTWSFPLTMCRLSWAFPTDVPAWRGFRVYTCVYTHIYERMLEFVRCFFCGYWNDVGLTIILLISVLNGLDFMLKLALVLIWQHYVFDFDLRRMFIVYLQLWL